MSNEINWAEKVAQGRAKAHGVPWNDAENNAIYNLGIPAEFVREGVLTLEAYEEAKNKDKSFEDSTGEKPLNKMNKTELEEKAKSLGLEFTPSATKAALIEIISNKLNEKGSEDTSDEDVDESGSESNEDEN